LELLRDHLPQLLEDVDFHTRQRMWINGRSATSLCGNSESLSRPIVQWQMDLVASTITRSDFTWFLFMGVY